MIKEKACKSQGKAKGFDGCGEPTAFRKYGLCRICFAKWLYSTDEGKETIRKATIIGKKKSEKEERKKSKAEKEKLINYRSKLQTKIQEIVRLIDIGLPCLARGFHSNVLHGGHIYARGGNSSMALNLHNIHRQGAQSNHFQNDDGLLREGLVKEYGIEYLEFIGELRRTPQLHYTNEEYKSFFKKASEISLDLKRNGETFSMGKRISMRNTINLSLGIYSPELCIFNDYIITIKQ